MPELPDVEGFRRVLAKNGLRKTIDRITVSDARILGKISAQTFASCLQGTKLIAVRRHGKHLMAHIDRGGLAHPAFRHDGRAPVCLEARRRTTTLHPGAFRFRQ